MPVRIVSKVNYKMNLKINYADDHKKRQSVMLTDAPVCKKCYFVIKLTREKYFHLN